MLKIKQFYRAAVTITAALLLLASGACPALENPAHSRADRRIQYADYRANDVVRVNAANGCITTLKFSEGESVVNYGSGYSTAWEFAASGNHFFMKPKDKDGTTNLVIVTNRRIYSLDIHLMPQPSQATYLLTFRYPGEARKAREEKERQSALDGLLGATDPNVANYSPTGNYNYTMNFAKSEGSKLMAPVQVFDDGRFTYFRFRQNQDFPAVYKVSADGEAIVNSHVEDGVLVVHGVYGEYRLRAGQDVVGVYNENFGIYSRFDSTEPADTTTIPGLGREVR